VAELLVGVSLVLSRLLAPILQLECCSESTALSYEIKDFCLHVGHNPGLGANADHLLLIFLAVTLDVILLRDNQVAALLVHLLGAVSMNILHHGLEVARVKVFEHQVTRRLPGISVLGQGDTEVVRKQIGFKAAQLDHIMHDPVPKALSGGLWHHTLLINGVESAIESGPNRSREQNFI